MMAMYMRMETRWAFTILLCGILLAGCSGTNLRTIQEGSESDLRSAIERDDYVTASSEIEDILALSQESATARNAVGYIKKQPDYQNKLAEAYKVRIAKFKDNAKAYRYKAITDGIESLQRNGVLTRDVSRNLMQDAQRAILEQIPSMQAPTLKVIVNTYNFGAEVQDAAKLQYNLALVQALEENEEWARNNVDEYVAHITRGAASEEFIQAFTEHVGTLTLSWDQKQALRMHLQQVFGDLPAIQVHTISTSKPNSAGGVDTRIRFKVGTQGIIKYARFTAVPYNPVGDVMTSSIDNESEKTLTLTGPLEPNRFVGGRWKDVWYNNTISCIEITTVEIEFMNDVTEIYSGERVKSVLQSPELNRCP